MIEISGAYDGAVPQKVVPHIILCRGLFTFAGWKLGTVFFCWLEELKLAGILIL